MERTETTRKTLAVGRSILTAKPQAPGEKTLKQQLPEPSALSGSTGSGSGREDSVARTQENGVRVRVRVSDNTNRGAVETEIAKMTSGSGSSSSPFKIKENEREGVVGGSENVKGLNSVSGVNKKEEQGCEKIAAAAAAKSVLIGGRSGKKAVSKIEVKKGRDLNKKYGYVENGAPLSENGEDPDDLMLEMSEKKDGEEEEEEEEDVGNEEYEYAVGDFVWGKIKSHPWWPGRIYNPSDASEYAAKYSHKDHLLVAYFGDGTFAWCYPSQLQPFEDNFEEMSKQTNSKNFVKAVEGALDEFSRVVELEMACSCVLKENKVGFARPVAMNAGIKEGVFVPEGGIGQHSIAQFEPAKFLANLRYTARVVSVNSVLELNVLKSQLAAFYRAKGVYELPRYTEPEYIIGLEDKIRSNGEVDVPIQGPFEEDWLSLPVSPGFNKTGQMSSQKWPMISEDKLYQRRKQKSIAEIMGGEMDVKPKNNEENMAKEGTHSGKLASISTRRKKKGSDEAETHASDNLSSPPGKKKKIKLSGTPITTENKVPKVENASGRGNEETRKGRGSRERKAKRSSHVKDDDDGVREGIENGSVSRERKKSKYLSPPYTSLQWGERNSSFKKDSKLEFLEVASVARVGERMSKAAGQLVGSPPIVKCSADAYQKNVSRELSTERDTSGGLNPETSKQDENKMIDPMATKASANKVLSQILSAALNPPPGNQLPSHPSLAPFSADPGFAERAARFSCFSSNRNFSSLNGQFGPSESGKLSRVSSNQSLKISGSQMGVQENKDGLLQDRISASDKKFSRFSRSSTPENAETGDSREESSVSEQIPGGEIGLKGQNDANARKRKLVPRGKAKDISSFPCPSAKDAKVAAENDELNSKRSKLDESNAKAKAEANGSPKTAGDGNQKKSKDSPKPPEPPKDYIHVRARRGQATDSHSLAERVRREKISERMKFLQDLVPGCNKVTGKAVMLDEIINYVQSLQRQVEFLSMKLSTVNPRMDFNMDALLSKEMFQSRGTLAQTIYPSDPSAPAFPYGINLQVPSLQSGINPNGTETHFSMNAALRRNPGIQLPPVDGFGEAASQVSAFWEDDLQSVVQMGFGQNQSQSFHGTMAASQMKIEL